MKAVKPPVSSCRSRMRRRCSTRSAGVSSEPNIMVAVVFMPRPCATRMTSSQVSVGILCGLISPRTRSTSTSAPPPGSESRPAARRRRSVSSIARPLCRAMWTTSGGERQCRWSLRVALADAAEDLLEPADVEIGVQPALHHDRGAAESQRLVDLAVDVLLGQEVALPAPRLLVEGAEAAPRETVVGVVDVAVDDERDLGAGVQAAADLVGAGAELEQVAVQEQVERLLVAQAPPARRRLREARSRHGTADDARSGASSSSPIATDRR